MQHELLTRDELAARFGKDVRTITNYVQAGMPQRSKSGKPVYSWPECRDWWEKWIREDARASRGAAGDQDKKVEMAELKLREQRALTEQAELDVGERRRALVTVEFMHAEFRRTAEAFRAGLLSIPASWDGRLAGCTTSVERQLALQDGVNELLPLIGGLVDDDGEAADATEEAPLESDDAGPEAVAP